MNGWIIATIVIAFFAFLAGLRLGYAIKVKDKMRVDYSSSK